jgi:hypothetical protein
MSDETTSVLTWSVRKWPPVFGNIIWDLFLCERNRKSKTGREERNSGIIFHQTKIVESNSSDLDPSLLKPKESLLSIVTIFACELINKVSRQRIRLNINRNTSWMKEFVAFTTPNLRTKTWRSNWFVFWQFSGGIVNLSTITSVDEFNFSWRTNHKEVGSVWIIWKRKVNLWIVKQKSTSSGLGDTTQFLDSIEQMKRIWLKLNVFFFTLIKRNNTLNLHHLRTNSHPLHFPSSWCADRPNQNDLYYKKGIKIKQNWVIRIVERKSWISQLMLT